jgi:hypothetical protein
MRSQEYPPPQYEQGISTVIEKPGVSTAPIGTKKYPQSMKSQENP